MVVPCGEVPRNGPRRDGPMLLRHGHPPRRHLLLGSERLELDRFLIGAHEAGRPTMPRRTRWRSILWVRLQRA